MTYSYPQIARPRPMGLRLIVPFTLRIMSDVAREAFVRVQRFSTDWHANSFAGSTVRKVTRGMWALDLYNDTILLALLSVLLGSMVLHWASLGLVIALGAVLYVAMTATFSMRYIAPAARVSNAWDTRVVSRWRKRVNRTWLRYNTTAAVQLTVLLALRASAMAAS